ncbi:MAG: DUF4382 domain-containing protein [Cyclobacteriaceae bacterium]
MMKTTNSKFKYSLVAIVTLASAFILSSCSDGEVNSKGKATVGVTDAAVDAENVTGVYLAVSEIQARSNSEFQTIATFDSPEPFNVMAYQNGEVYALGEGEIEAGTYDEIRFILDDASESSYITFDDETRAAIDVPSGTTSGYKVKGDFEIASSGQTNIIVDIDLRKALVVTGQGDYKLRPTARLITNDETGTIKGSLNVSGEDRIVVYAYAEGTYSDSEGNEPAEGEARFDGSVNSAVVAEDGSFTLAFMQEGNYELVTATYEMNDTEETYEFKSVVEADLWINGSITNLVTVESNSTVNLTIDLSL